MGRGRASGRHWRPSGCHDTEWTTSLNNITMKTFAMTNSNTRHQEWTWISKSIILKSCKYSATDEKERQLESALCWDANPRRLQRQSCCGWRLTMGQLLYEVSRKYHFTFSFDSVLCNWVNYSQGITYVLWHPAHSDIIFDPRAITVRGAFVHKIWRV